MYEIVGFAANIVTVKGGIYVMLRLARRIRITLAPEDE
jgi:hypothetical protein